MKNNEKKTYKKPQMELLGSLADMTQSGSGTPPAKQGTRNDGAGVPRTRL